MMALRLLLVFDAAVLMLVGLGLILIPGRLEGVFHFSGMGADVHYLVSMWGCVLATMGMGYVVAATDPVKHKIWIIVGIARGLLEVLVGLGYVATGAVSLQSAAFGLVVAAFVAVAYAILYPRQAAVA